MALSPQERILRARLAAHTLHSKVDPTEHTAPARKAFLERFEKEVAEEFPDLPAEEIRRRADHRMRAHMTRLALKSSQARRKAAAT